LSVDPIGRPPTRLAKPNFRSEQSAGAEALQPIEGTYLAVDTYRMAKKPEPPKPISWNVYKIASKAVWLAEVEGTDEAAAIEKAATEFKVPATKLMAIRR
jgi:hypothetical protein